MGYKTFDGISIVEKNIDIRKNENLQLGDNRPFVTSKSKNTIRIMLF